MENKSISELLSQFLLSPRLHIGRHVLLQIALICITLNSFWDVPDHLILTWGRFWAWLVYFLFMTVAIYVNIYVLAPRFLMKNKLTAYLTAVFFLILLSLVTIVLLQSYFQQLVSGSYQIIFAVLNLLSGIFTVGLLIAGVSALLLFRYWLDYTQRIRELESNTLQSELKFLKSQINPHFLFNMLNNANVLIRKDPEEATRVLARLKDLLHYQFNDSLLETVTLASEICFLNDFLSLEKIRRDHFSFRILQEGQKEDIRIPPLLFIPFVENAVKHNTDGENESYVNLSFHMESKQIHFYCENSKVPRNTSKDTTGGLGLKNIQRRLELLFPGKHTLEVKENTQTYVVYLTIILNKE